jgi:hypothetical protein
MVVVVPQFRALPCTTVVRCGRTSAGSVINVYEGGAERAADNTLVARLPVPASVSVRASPPAVQRPVS